MNRFIMAPLSAIRHRLGRFYAWTGFGDKKLIDYIQLIVLPFVLILGGQLVSQAVNASSRAQALEQAQEQRLQDYLDQMASLALDRELLGPDLSRTETAVIREVARARTITALDAMDGERKRFVVTFLYELGLINGVGSPISLAGSSLDDANLSEAELFAANLTGAELSRANLRKARLTLALLNYANLSNANLDDALLVDTRLNQADLRLASLRNVDASNASMFNADLRGADLREAGLSGANLRSADLRGADLSGADLRGANLSGAAIGGEASGQHMATEVDDVLWEGATCPDQTIVRGEVTSCVGHFVTPGFETPATLTQ